MEILHIYAQSCGHDEAWIAGNHEGLMRLRDAIDKALLDGRGDSDSVFTTDGEGYQVIAVQMTDAELGKLGMPYTDNIATSSGGVWPWTMVPNAKLSGPQ